MMGGLTRQERLYWREGGHHVLLLGCNVYTIDRIARFGKGMDIPEVTKAIAACCGVLVYLYYRSASLAALESFSISTESQSSYKSRRHFIDGNRNVSRQRRFEPLVFSYSATVIRVVLLNPLQMQYI